LKKNDFYISGESYAGIYVPWLAWKILQHNEMPSSRDTIIKLKGVLVGNACTDPLECSAPGKYGSSMYQYEFLFKHGYYTDIDYDHFRAACLLDYNSTQCIDLRQKMDEFFTSTRTSILNIYNPCYGLESGSVVDNAQPDLTQPMKKKWKLKQSGRKQLVGD